MVDNYCFDSFIEVIMECGCSSKELSVAPWFTTGSLPVILYSDLWTGVKSRVKHVTIGGEKR